MNGPLKNEESRQVLPILKISQNLLMGLGVSDFVSVGHIFAFLSSHNTFSSRAWILRCQSRRLGESRIYHSPPLLSRNRLFYVLFKNQKVFFNVSLFNTKSDSYEFQRFYMQFSSSLFAA